MGLGLCGAFEALRVLARVHLGGGDPFQAPIHTPSKRRQCRASTAGHFGVPRVRVRKRSISHRAMHEIESHMRLAVETALAVTSLGP